MKRSVILVILFIGFISPKVIRAEDLTSSSITTEYNSATTETLTSDSIPNKENNSTKTETTEKLITQSMLKSAEVLNLDEGVVIQDKTYYPVSTEDDVTYQMGKNRNIYLKNNLTILKGHKIYDGFSIYGADLTTGEKYTLNLDGKNTLTNGFYNNTTTKTDTFVYSVNITSTSYYGIISFADNTLGTQYYDDVNYTTTNSQPFHAESAIVYIKNSKFTQTNGGSQAQEFMEGTKLILEGDVEINHDSNSGMNTNTFMWWRIISGDSGNYLKILDNSNVTINTTKTLIYNSATPSNFQIDVGSNSVLNLGLGGNLYNVAPSISNNINIGDNSAVNILDNSTQRGWQKQPSLWTFNQEGTINFGEGSSLKMVSNNRDYVLAQEESDKNKPFIIPNNQGNIVLENTLNQGSIYNLATNMYVENKANNIYFNDVLGIVGDYSKIKFVKTNTSYLEGNNDKFIDLYKNTTKLEYKPTKKEDYQLSVNSVYSSTGTITGTTIPNATVWIKYVNKSGELVEESMLTTSKEYTFNLKDKIKTNSSFEIFANTGGKDYLPVDSVTGKVIDDVNPVGEAVFQEIPRTEVLKYNYESSLTNIQDDSEEPVTIEVIKPFDETVGYSEAVIKIVDSSGNSTEINLSAFITDSTTQVIGTMNERLLILPSKFNGYSSDITDVTSYLESLEYKIITTTGVNIKENTEFIETNLVTIPDKGSYIAKYKINNLMYDLNIEIEDSVDLINIDIPNKLNFGSYNGIRTENNIISPKYSIKNNGVNEVSIYIQDLDTVNADNINLTDNVLGARDLSLSLETPKGRFNLKNSDDANILTLPANTEQEVKLTGKYGKDYTQVYTPKYLLNLYIK